VRAEVGRERLGRDKLHLALQHGLQEVRQSHEAIEALLSRRELYEEIHIAIGSSLVPQHGAKERKPTHAEAPDLSLNGLQAADRLVARECA
jgi:hypothetical protein